MANRFLRRPEVEKLTGLSRSTLYSQMAAGSFPRPCRISRRAVAWTEAEVEHWISIQPKADPRDVHQPGRIDSRRTA